jgi:heat shock protein HslJ
LAAGSSIAAATSCACAQQVMMTDQEIMDALKAAAPAAMLNDATIFNMGAGLAEN